MFRGIVLILTVLQLTACSVPSVDPATAHDGGFTAPPLAFDFRSPAEGQGRCRFAIDPNTHRDWRATPLPEARWTRFVEGPCRYSFYVGSDDNPYDNGTLVLYETGPEARVDAAGDYVSGYFVYLNFRDRQLVTADGSWNGARNVSHAHTTIGSFPDYPMRRDGACWVSDRARICLEPR